MVYRIEKVSLRDDLVRVKVSDEISETDFTLYATDWFSLLLKEGSQIDDEQYHELVRMHGYCFAYRKCLRKLAYKDHSVAEIRELLRKQDNIDDSQRQEILQRLQESRLLDDERLVNTAFEFDEARLIGKRKTAYDLKERGIELPLIEVRKQQVSEAEETDRCLQKAEMLVKLIRHRSHRETLSILRQKLSQNGFESPVISLALSRLQLEKDEDQELDNLRAVIEKAYRRYRTHYQGYELKNRIYTQAMRKGYSGDDINTVLCELEVIEDENQ